MPRITGRAVQVYNNKVYNKYGMNCYICGIELDDTNKSVDHIQPIAKGGQQFDLENGRPCCLQHNLEKGTKTGAVRVTWINEKYLSREVLMV